MGCTEEEYNRIVKTVNQQVQYNGWFISDNVRMSLRALGEQLVIDKLNSWGGGQYSDTSKKILVVMAGNIPLVGFHDFLTVLISGHSVACKLSSDDNKLLPELAGLLLQFVPELKQRIEFVAGKATGFEAVIATGSDNSATYFELYFGSYPHVFRKNRTSIAVLDGTESQEEMSRLGDDVFSYFGLGCRNVTHLMVPKGYDLNKFFSGIHAHSEVINNNKYGNNYDYNKAVYLMNQHQLLDNNFVLLRESDELFSPLSMIHYHYYVSEEEVARYLEDHAEEIQVVVGKKYTDFGQAQRPALDDYADGFDTLSWLNNL